MDLWHGTLGEFLRTASSGSLPGDMAGRWVNLHRSLPGPGELRSWEASLPALADALRPLAGRDLGVALGAGRVAEGGDGAPGVAVEYHLPLTGRRIDVLLTGRDSASRPRALALELKQWSEAALEDGHATNLTVGGREVVHPSEQALDYAGWMSEFGGEARRLGARLKEFDLRGQFRCGGCVEFLEWVDGLLGFGPPRAPAWGGRYAVEMASSPGELAALVPECRGRGETARLVAGFCWKWSAPLPDGTLVPDVVIGEWRMPWNEQAGNRSWKPENHPYTRWAETEVGERQVGCIYSAQGFEFGRVGVIWGRDLVWRRDRWVAQKGESQDRPVKGAADMLGLVRNAYRVLLTRGIAGVRLLVLDEETRAHVEEALRAPTGVE